MKTAMKKEESKKTGNRLRKFIRFCSVLGSAALAIGFLVSIVEKREEQKKLAVAEGRNRLKVFRVSGETAKIHIPYGAYEAYWKRPLDFAFSSMLLLFLSPVLLVLTLLVRVKLGSPVIFAQERPGIGGRIFTLYKFRSMTSETDEKGELLPDEVRLTKFGRMLRATSLDELPELLNIWKGDMSVVGPRPLLVRYLPLYNSHQARRHEVRPGVTGYAQVHGRNAITWEEKFEKDVWYVDHVSFWQDIRILFGTVQTVLKREGIHSDTSVTMEEFQGTSMTVDECKETQGAGR